MATANMAIASMIGVKVQSEAVKAMAGVIAAVVFEVEVQASAPARQFVSCPGRQLVFNYVVVLCKVACQWIRKLCSGQKLL